MAVLSKSFDSSTNSMYRSVTFDHTEFSVDDILDIVKSLGRNGTRLEVDAASDASVTFRLNAYSVTYGLNTDYLTHGIDRPDWNNSAEYIDTNLNTTVVENGETLIEAVSIKNIQITALTPGSGTGVTFKIR